MLSSSASPLFLLSPSFVWLSFSTLLFFLSFSALSIHLSTTFLVNRSFKNVARCKSRKHCNLQWTLEPRMVLTCFWTALGNSFPQKINCLFKKRFAASRRRICVATFKAKPAVTGKPCLEAASVALQLQCQKHQAALGLGLHSSCFQDFLKHTLEDAGVAPHCPLSPFSPFTWMQDPFPFSLFFEMGIIVHDRPYCKLLRSFLLLFKPPYPWLSNWSPKTKNSSEQQTLNSCVSCSCGPVCAGARLRFSVCVCCVVAVACLSF